MTEHEQAFQDWIGQLADGDSLVVQNFWSQYITKLENLAGQHLAARLQRRVGPEDIAQSVCRTFLRRVQEGQFTIDDGDSLWRLLCAITLTKVREKARYHQRKKRSIGREESSSGNERGVPFDPASHEPTPEEAAAFAEEFDLLLGGLDEEEQQLVQLKLAQHTNEEIAEKLGCSERTVRRIVKRVQLRLESILETGA